MNIRANGHDADVLADEINPIAIKSRLGPVADLLELDFAGLPLRDFISTLTTIIRNPFWHALAVLIPRYTRAEGRESEFAVLGMDSLRKGHAEEALGEASIGQDLVVVGLAVLAVADVADEGVQIDVVLLGHELEVVVLQSEWVFAFAARAEVSSLYDEAGLRGSC